MIADEASRRLEDDALTEAEKRIAELEHWLGEAKAESMGRGKCIKDALAIVEEMDELAERPPPRPPWVGDFARRLRAVLEGE